MKRSRNPAHSLASRTSVLAASSIFCGLSFIGSMTGSADQRVSVRSVSQSACCAMQLWRQLWEKQPHLCGILCSLMPGLGAPQAVTAQSAAGRTRLFHALVSQKFVSSVLLVNMQPQTLLNLTKTCMAHRPGKHARHGRVKGFILGPARCLPISNAFRLSGAAGEPAVVTAAVREAGGYQEGHAVEPAHAGKTTAAVGNQSSGRGS